MAQRKEAKLVEFRTSAIGNGDLCRALEILVALVGRKDVSRKTFDLSTVFSTANGRAPTGLGECIGEACSEYICAIRPAVVIVLDRHWFALLVEVHFFKVELIDGLGVLAIGKP